MANNELVVKGIEINFKKINKEEYISLTDLARYANPEEPKIPIQTWMRNKDVIGYLGLWESIHNPYFKGIEFTTFETAAGKNSFYLSPQRWIEKTNAIGIISKSGNNGGTYAHSDIAFEFASWLSPEFKLYLITEFQRLKKSEQKELDWDAKRELAKLNYHIHTDVIKENLIVPNLTKEQINFIYANEADLLNVALFGKTALQWKNDNPSLKGNIRDYASIDQLLVLANMESYNAILIEQNLSQKERLIQLNQMAKSQLTVLKNHQPKYLSINKK
ncbi:MAG: KilA-N domain-containing protein [Anaeroplasmataceae bacterium]|nr:KilA-N domain-containing protein [Anaeroplasmataceae bacterium]